MIPTSVVRRLRRVLPVAVVAVVAVGAVSPAGASASGCAPTSDAYAQAVLADAPVAYYRLDEASGPTLCDSSAAGASGTYTSSGVTYGVAGTLGSTTDTAVGASNPGSAIGSAGSSLTGNHSFTLESWFRRTDTTRNQVLLSMGTDSASGHIAGLATWSNADPSQFGPSVGTVGPSELGLDEYEATNHWDTSTAGVDIWDGSWHLLAVTYDQSTDQVTGYVDGKSLGPEAPAAPAFNLGASPIRVGYWVDPAGQGPVNYPLIGDQDESAIYGTALSATRIAAHFQSASSSSSPPPPPGDKRATATAVSCTYSVATSADTCTALVGDASTNAMHIAPTGSVAFASPRGLFTLGSSCNLTSSPTTPSISSCSVNYLPPDMYLPTITATYGGDAQHAASSGHTQYRGTNGASTYESVFSPDPGAFSNKVTVTVPVPADDSTAIACALSALSGASGSVSAVGLGGVLTTPELQALAAKLDAVVAETNFALSAGLQQKADGFVGQILHGLTTDAGQRAGIIRLPFFKDVGDDLGKIMGDGLAKLQPDMSVLTNLFVEDVVDSIPTDPQARAQDLSSSSVAKLLDDIAGIEKAEDARCSTTGHRALGAAAARRPARRVSLARLTRTHVKAGTLKLPLRLSKRRLAKLAGHRKSVRLAIVVNLTMPSALLPHGYPRSVVELVTLHRGKPRHKKS